MVMRHNRRPPNDSRRASARLTTNRTPERHDLLPWADPYIASLIRTHEIEQGRAARETSGEHA